MTAQVIPYFTAGLVVLAVVLMFFRPLIHLIRLVLRSSLALLLLKLLQDMVGLLGISLGVNLCNALVLGLLGIPGFGLLLMLKWLFKV